MFGQAWGIVNFSTHVHRPRFVRIFILTSLSCSISEDNRLLMVLSFPKLDILVVTTSKLGRQNPGRWWRWPCKTRIRKVAIAFRGNPEMSEKLSNSALLVPLSSRLWDQSLVYMKAVWKLSRAQPLSSKTSPFATLLAWYPHAAKTWTKSGASDYLIFF